MESTRQKKFARAIQRELSDLLQKEVEGELGVMITLNHIKTTPDLQLARAYITVLPEEKTAQTLALLEQENWQIRHALAKRIRNMVKQMPELQFFEDDTLKTAARLEDLFRDIDYTTPDGEEPLEGYKA
ncbi:MAG: 30S ribosome-binding factor RbfA [Bacteroidetes bacterium]|jgi:ribosome-binding factor A|nr:30S ribosome-binding factor RbfA [Bacteroidota bacterium]